MAQKARHAFGRSANIDTALEAGTIDAYDILFLDGDGDAKIGWIDKDGKKVIVENTSIINVEGGSLPENGEKEKIYIFEDEAYIWNGTAFKTVSKSADVSSLEEQIALKVDENRVKQLISESVESSDEVVEF